MRKQKQELLNSQERRVKVMVRFNSIHLNQLKLLEKLLFSEYKKNRMFKRIYESNNKKTNNEEEIVKMFINNPELFTLIDSISGELANYITNKEKLAKKLFEGEVQDLSIDDCFEVLQVVHNMIDFLENELMI